MPTFVFDAVIDWPNGKGETPCTQAYLDKMAEAAEIRSKYDSNFSSGFVPLDDMSRDDYEAVCCIENDLSQMQLDGHVGKGVRY